MKTLYQYLLEDGVGAAPSAGAAPAGAGFATPGNTMGMGDVAAPSDGADGSGDIPSGMRTAKYKKEKKNTSKTKRI